MLQKVLIRLKGDSRVLVATADSQVILSEITALTTGHTWSIADDGTITNALGNRALTVPRSCNSVVACQFHAGDGQRATKWKVTDKGMIQHSGGFGMCLCVPDGQVRPEVRLADEDVRADSHFYWELLSEEGRPLSAGVDRRIVNGTDEADQPTSSFGYPGPGPQTPTLQDVMVNAFFVKDAEWNAVRSLGEFDFVVIGSGFCGLAFAARALQNNAFARILILERGSLLLPDHFQNLPLPFLKSLKGVSETHPWSVTQRTHEGKYVKFQHGVVPFVGGRSTTWSGWCPKPSSKEMEDWPEEAVRVVHKYFGQAEKLMNVVRASEIFNGEDGKSLYGILQRELAKALGNTQRQVDTVTRVEPASLAAKAPNERHIPFHKFAVPGPLFQLLEDQREKAALGKGWIMKLAVNCIVTRILHTAGKATALETSRGVVTLGDATKVVLAMGTLPPTTLILNSFSKEHFPSLINVGERFTGHTVSAVTARIPKSSLPNGDKMAGVELGAMYIAGLEPSSGAQYHIQLSAVLSTQKGWVDAFHYFPDVRASPSKQQFATSEDHILIVCAVLGELDHLNKDNWFRLNASSGPCENTDIQIVLNKQDELVWSTMETATFQVLETTFGGTDVEYWHETSAGGKWCSERPPVKQIRGPGIVHEASTMWMGDEGDVSAPTGLDYRPRGVENVYITGAALYPRCGSWNPTGPMVAMAIHLADAICPPAM